MLSFSTWSRRSLLSGMTPATGLFVLVMLLSACGSSSVNTPSGPTPTSGTNPTATACSVSLADLGAGASKKATPPDDKATGTLTVGDSRVLQPLVTQASNEYLATNKDAKITVNAGGSKTGLGSVESGSAQNGMSDLFAKDVSTTAYTDLVDHQLGVVTFALVVNPDVAAKITNLTTEQIGAIFTGQILNWKELGGPDEPIITVERP